MSTSFGIRITAQARHADLWEAAQAVGGASSLARLLKICPATVCKWINLQHCPRFAEDLEDEYTTTPRKRIERRLKRLEKKIFRVTGKMLDEIWPRELRYAIKSGRIASKIDFRKEIDLKRLTSDFRARALLPSPEDLACRVEVEERIDDLLRTLSFRERKIVEMRFGLAGNCESTLEVVGKEFKISRDRVHQIESKAIRKLTERAERMGFPLDDMMAAIDATRGAVIIEGHARVIPENEIAATVA